MSSFPYKVKAVFEYKSPHEDDLNFPNGQIITVTEEEDADWYIGEYLDASGNSLSGLFPKNFVERYEPEAPPRPSRSRPKKEQPVPLSPPADPIPIERELVAEPPAPPQVVAAPEPTPAAKPAVVAASTAAKTAAPPPVAEKPSSFRDRIAAFNKPSAPPIAPVKPGAPSTASSSSFVKKPFIAPPPARDAYVPPPPRDIPTQKIYRRDEDPEIVETQAQYQADAEKAGITANDNQEDPEDDAAKPTSLRDRIAALQKQQQEQAARRAEVTQKEKPKRPARKRTESGDQIPVAATEAEEPELERTGSISSNQPRISSDSSRDKEVPRPPPVRKPSHTRDISQDVLSDGNEADQSGAGETTEDAEDAESTEVEDLEENPKTQVPLPLPRTSTGSSRPIPPIAPEPYREVQSPEDDDEEDDQAEERGEGEEEEEEEEEEIDEETRRKIALRERMAKMSGGVGMHGMVPMPMPGPAPPKKRTSMPPNDTRGETSSVSRQVPVPVAGMQRAQSPEALNRSPEVEKEPEAVLPITSERAPEVVPDVEDVKTRPTQPPAPLPVRNLDEPTTAAPPTNSRAPPPPPRPSKAADLELDSDDEVPTPAQESLPAKGSDAPRRAVPPLPPPTAIPSKPEGPRSPPPPPKRTSQLGETSAVDEQTPQLAKAPTIRAPPPIPATPSMPPAPVTEARSPPPPPPPTAAPPSRRSTQEGLLNEDDEDEAEDGESDYEGDYDTDIAPGQSHKNALAQNKERSIDDTTLSEDTKSPIISPVIPQASPRVAPPPPPPDFAATPQQPEPTLQESDYDPYRYNNPMPSGVLPTHRKTRVPIQPVLQESDPALYEQPPPAAPAARAPPPPVPQSPPPQPYDSPPPPVAASRRSNDAARASVEPVRRPSMTTARKSTEQPRTSIEQGIIARDVDLGINSLWWTSPNTPPPVFQNRADVLCEFEESSTSKRGGRTSISKDIYVLFQDYSQTIIAARFDPKDPADVALEQRHEPPPPRLRQDQLEEAHSRIGQSIAAAVSSKQNTTVGDGSSFALVLELLKSQPNTLKPVGTRAFGALVYANMANATVQQIDEIRPGDIISFRNAKFSGKHGAMHAKYSEDVGKPEHVGVVTEWDGTKKKIRALEQGRENKKAKIESFRVGDLRSGEVKVWRVMGRNWVGWE